MIFTILITFLIIYLKGYKICDCFNEKSTIPFFTLEIILIIFQICVFFKVYYFIRFAKIIKSLFMLSLLIPFFKYKLYKQGLIGSAFIISGTLMNKVAMYFNAGKMPVFPTLSKITGYADAANAIQMGDSLHIIGDQTVKLKCLTDIFDVGYCILSLGDIFIRIFVIIILYSTFTKVCRKRDKKHACN